MIQTYTDNNCISSPWWLVAGTMLTGNVLVVGELEEGDLCLMRILAKSVTYLTVDEFESGDFSASYNAIILITLSIKKQSRLNDLASRIIGGLSEEGVLAVYGRNARPYGFATQLIMPCITYGKYPSESYLPGHYSSNKNQCLLKERIKNIVLNMPLYKLFISNHIYIYSKSSTPRHLLAELSDVISRIPSPHTHHEINRSLSRIYYKYGKLIAIFKSSIKASSLVVVIPTDSEARYQRENEFNTITTLQANKWLKAFVVDFYIESEVLGFKACIMDEVDGYTVDAPCKGFTTMQDNAYSMIRYLATHSISGTFEKTILSNKIIKYVHEFNNRMSSYDIMIGYNIDILVNSLVDLPIVCMHGDLKLENFVLDRLGSVKKIIDWELSDIKGFPLLDLFYFIAYNDHIENACSLTDSIYKLANRKYNANYYRMVEEYSAEYNISASQIESLYVIFVIHHFACRVHIDHITPDELSCMKKFFNEHIIRFIGNS